MVYGIRPLAGKQDSPKSVFGRETVFGIAIITEVREARLSSKGARIQDQDGPIPDSIV